MDTEKSELMIEMLDREVGTRDMEGAWGLHDMMEEAIGRGLVHTSGLGGEASCPP